MIYVLVDYIEGLARLIGPPVQRAKFTWPNVLRGSLSGLYFHAHKEPPMKRRFIS